MTRIKRIAKRVKPICAYLLRLAQLAIPHQQLRKLFQQRVISRAEVLGLGKSLGRFKLEARVQLRGLLVDMGNHVGHDGGSLVVETRVLAVEVRLAAAGRRRKRTRARRALHLVLHDLGGMLQGFLVTPEDLRRKSSAVIAPTTHRVHGNIWIRTRELDL